MVALHHHGRAVGPGEVERPAEQLPERQPVALAHKHVQVAVSARTDDGEALLGPGAGVGRVEPDHHVPVAGGWPLGDSRAVEPGAPKECPLHVFEHLAVQLRPPEPGPLIAFEDTLAERARQVVEVVEGGPPADHRPRPGKQRSQLGAGGRCGRKARTRVGTHPQPEQQVVERLREVAPRPQLVPDREVMLRPSQPLRLVGGIDAGDSPVGPGKAPARRLIHGPLPIGADREYTGRPLHQHVPGVRRGGAYDRRLTRRALAHTAPQRLYEASGLTHPAPPQEHEDRPLPRRLALLGPRMAVPVVLGFVA